MLTIKDAPLPINQIICGECSEVMSHWPDECIDLTVTSPPYGDLRDYKGFVFEFEKVAKELYRVTKKGGVVVWVVADQTVDGDESGESFRQALGFKEVGFKLHDTMIYGKNSFLHQGGARYYQLAEYMFVLSKGTPKTFTPIKRKTNHPNPNHKSSQRLPDGSMLSHKYEVGKETSKIGNIWQYGTGYCKTTTDAFCFKHPAMFPEALAHDHIISWSNPGDLVLDPFVGSGTTPKMAAKLDRNWIGIDISEEYCQLSRERVELITNQYKMDFGGDAHASKYAQQPHE